MPSPRLRLLAAALGAAGLLVATPAAQASTPCPATFRVLHNDRIGELIMPAGTYTVRVERMSCARASSLFAVFLNDYDGRLPRGWVAANRGRGRAAFARGSKSFAVAYRRKRSTKLACATPYTVASDTQAGPLILLAGQYRVTRLSAVSPTCSRAAELLTSFLGQLGPVLPGGWTSLPLDGSFVQGAATYGFRVAPL